MGIFIISYLHFDIIYGLLRFGPFVEDDQLLYLWGVPHFMWVNDLHNETYASICMYMEREYRSV